MKKRNKKWYGKKVVAVFLVVLMTVCMLQPMAVFAQEDEQQKQNASQVVLPLVIKDDSCSQEYETNVEFDFRWLTTACDFVYNSKLAIAANLMATDVYDTKMVKVKDAEYTQTSFLEALGFEDVESFEITDGGTGNDVDDIGKIMLGHHLAEIDGEKYDVYAAVICGTRNSQEWQSDFDIGADSQDYIDVTGEHPEWTHKELHKGFDVLANRMKKVLDNYLAEKSVSADAKKSLLLTGHSRGAAVANILGSYYEKDASLNSYTYTFSCPNTTTVSEETAKSYGSIFNINDGDDFITTLPLKKWGYCRYGTDYTYSLSENEKMRQLFEKYVGREYYGCDITELKEAFENSPVGEKEEIYRMKDVPIEDYTVEYYRAYSQDLNMGKFFQVSEERQEDGKYHVVYCEAFILRAFATAVNALNTGEHMVSTLVKVLYLATIQLGYNDLVKALKDDSSYMSDPHMLQSTFAIASSIQGEENLDHTGGSATTKHGPICERCGKEYGEKLKKEILNGSADEGNGKSDASSDRIATENKEARDTEQIEQQTEKKSQRTSALIKKNVAVKTGDDADIMLLFVSLFSAMIIGVSCYNYRKRKF